MTNDKLVLYGGIIAIVLVVVLYLIYWFREKKAVNNIPDASGNNSINLRLQAYERLVLLTERIALPNLITRVPPGDLDIRTMQAVLVDLQTGKQYGGADKRREGTVIGLPLAGK